jgi:fucose permease
MLVSVLVSGPVLDRFGMKPPLALGPALVAGALAMMQSAGSYAALMPAVAVLGFGGGMLNAAANTLVADLHEDARRKAAAINLLGVFFGFGALLLPFFMGGLLDRLGLNAILACAAGLCLVAGAFSALLAYQLPKSPQRLPLCEMAAMLGSPFVLLMGALLFFESGNEFLLGGYLSTFLTAQLGAGVQQASLLLAVFWGGIMLSRVVLSRVLLRNEPHAVVAACALGAAAGSAWMGLAPSPLAAIGGIALTGASLAGVFTTAIGIAGARYPQRSGTVIGLLLTMGLSGGMLLPWLGARGAAAFGLRLVMWQGAAQFAVISVLALAVKRTRGVALP